MTNPKNQNTANAPREAESNTETSTPTPSVPSPSPREESSAASGNVLVRPAWPTGTLTIEDFVLTQDGVKMTRAEADSLQELMKERGVTSRLAIEDVK